MNKTVGLILLSLTLLTGLVIGQLSSLVRVPADSMITFSREASETALAYYDALNVLLETGDSSDLRAVLDTDFTDHSDEVKAVRTAEEFEFSLQRFARSFPGLHLQTAVSVVQGTIVGVDVNFVDAAPPVKEQIALEHDAFTSEFEILRVEGKKIIERWSREAMVGPGLIDTRASIEINVHRQLLDVYLERTTLAPDSRIDIAPFLGAVLLAESGSVDVTTGLDSVGSVGDEHINSTRLNAGHSMSVQNESSFTIENHGSDTATLLTATVRAVSATRSQYFQRSIVVEDPPGVASVELAYAPGDQPMTGRFLMSLSLVDLLSASAVASHTVAGFELAHVVQGDIAVEANHGKVRQSSAQGVVALKGGSLEVMAGDSIASPVGVSLDYRAGADSSAKMVLVTVVPTE